MPGLSLDTERVRIVAAVLDGLAAGEPLGEILRRLQFAAVDVARLEAVAAMTAAAVDVMVESWRKVTPLMRRAVARRLVAEWKEKRGESISAREEAGAAGGGGDGEGKGEGGGAAGVE